MINIMNNIPIFELPILIILVIIRSIILHHYGIKTIVFGNTNKTDYFIIPILFFFIYGIISSLLNLPFPKFLTEAFWKIDILNILSIIICSISIIWFAITLKVFGKSFRVGIDINMAERLIVQGPFLISRNPIYVGFIVFFIGFFVAYSNILSSVFLVIFIILVHRQILREEKFLKKHFGIEYEEYFKKVRRYI